jgi:hypothetical protein
MKKFVVLAVAVAFVFGMAMVTVPSTAQAGKLDVSHSAVYAGAAKSFVFYGYIKFRVSMADKSVPGSLQVYQRIPGDDTTKGENGKLQFNARQSRFGFKMTGDSFSGWKTAGRMEFDMFGGGYDHHGEVPRMRIGELYLTNCNTKITMGKGWAMFGTRHAPFVENFNSIVGDGFRRALRFDIAQKFPSGNNTFGAELMIMTFDSDGDFNTENLGFPYTSIELSMTSKAMGYAGGKGLGIWLQGIYGNMAEPDDIYDAGVKTRSGEDFDTYGVELDYYVPVISSKDRGKKAGNLALAGKFYYGQALGNAASLTLGYNTVAKPTSGLDEVQGYGGWVGLTYYVSNQVWMSVYGGYDAIDDEDYYPGTMVESAYNITANIFWRPARSIMFCAEYTYADNDYIDTDAYGNDNAKLNSFVLAAFYFF